MSELKILQFQLRPRSVTMDRMVFRWTAFSCELPLTRGQGHFRRSSGASAKFVKLDRRCQESMRLLPFGKAPRLLPKLTLSQFPQTGCKSGTDIEHGSA